jgi:hypothetical protein
MKCVLATPAASMSAPISSVTASTAKRVVTPPTGRHLRHAGSVMGVGGDGSRQVRGA